MSIKLRIRKNKLNENGTYNGNSFLNKAIYNDGCNVLYSSINERIMFEPADNKKGGIIVFSTDVNAISLSKNQIINKIKQTIETLKNRLFATKKIDKIANRNELVGWTVGHYLDGRYTDKKGNQYGENSLSVEIIGVDTEKLINIATTLCRYFKQESVLVKDYSQNRVMFVDGLL